VIYDAGPEDQARHLKSYVERGVKVVGGCCGTTPEHVAAIAAAVQ
jgi:methionine synthase I (cobalamin-dependent)